MQVLNKWKRHCAVKVNWKLVSCRRRASSSVWDSLYSTLLDYMSPDGIRYIKHKTSKSSSFVLTKREENISFADQLDVLFVTSFVRRYSRLICRWRWRCWGEVKHGKEIKNSRCLSERACLLVAALNFWFAKAQFTSDAALVNDLFLVHHLHDQLSYLCACFGRFVRCILPSVVQTSFCITHSTTMGAFASNFK